MKTLRPRVATTDLSIARLPPKRVDPYYKTADWQALRQEVFKRDGHGCSAPGCERQATTIDHIVARKAGGKDEASNLRGLCRQHDASIREDHLGDRRNGGRLTPR